MGHATDLPMLSLHIVIAAAPAAHIPKTQGTTIPSNLVFGGGGGGNTDLAITICSSLCVLSGKAFKVFGRDMGYCLLVDWEAILYTKTIYKKLFLREIF